MALRDARVVGVTTPFVNVGRDAPSVVQRTTRAPTTADVNYKKGTIWPFGAQIWMLSQVVAGSATWGLSSPGASDVDTLTGDSGGALSPAGGNLTIAGGTNITTPGAGSTITVNLDSAITLVTSVSSPIYTSTGAIDTNFNAVAGQDLIFKMGDAGGANKVSFVDSASAEVFSIDSNGNIPTIAGTLTVTGAITGSTSVISPLFTAPAGTDYQITSIAGQDVIVQMGDAAAANKVSFTDSGTAQVASLDSDGKFTAVNLDGIIGAVTPAAGTFTTVTGNTSIISPLFTAPVGTDYQITSIAGQDVIVQMGDAAAANKISFTDSATLEVASLDSDGKLIVTNLDGIIGAATPAAGVFTTVTGNTSVTSPLFTAPVGTDYQITSIAGQDVIIQMGDAIAANKISFTDSGTVEVASLDSDGKLIVTNLDGIIGAATPAAGVFTTVTGNTSVTSPLYTVGAGVDFQSTAAAGQDFIVQMGDAIGANKVSFTDSGTVEVASLDSDGTFTVKEVVSNFSTRSGDSITFTQSPLTGTAANTGGIASGATSDLNLLSFQEGIIMEQFVVGAGETIIKPVMTATGLLISGDETNLEGYEYNWGAARANSRHSFTIGTSAAFFLEWSFRADDISGLEPCLMGFRRTQANQTQGNLALYTDFVGYGLVDAVAGGDAVIQTQLNTGGINSTDTNDAWADAATHTLTVLVSGAGVVTFLFDGGAPTATQAYSFDNGDVVHPFFRHEFNAALPDAIEWISVKCGFQS